MAKQKKRPTPAEMEQARRVLKSKVVAALYLAGVPFNFNGQQVLILTKSPSDSLLRELQRVVSEQDRG